MGGEGKNRLISYGEHVFPVLLLFLHICRSLMSYTGQPNMLCTFPVSVSIPVNNYSLLCGMMVSLELIPNLFGTWTCLQ